MRVEGVDKSRDIRAAITKERSRQYLGTVILTGCRGQSGAVRKLEEKGLIAVEAVDRRRHPLVLTKSGRALHDRILPAALERERILLAKLSKAACLMTSQAGSG